MSELKFSVELDLKKLQQQVEEANRKLDAISKNAEAGAERAKRASQQITSANQGTANSFDRVAAMAKKAFAAFAVGDLVRQVINVRTEMDSLERSFVSLTQSTAKGQELTSWMKDFAAKTPLTVQGLAGATQTMLGFGLSADEAKKYITALGDISMGNQEKLSSLALAFSQMSSAGKLMGDDLRQMINAGFNPLTEIARKTGKSVGELKENLGAIPLEEVKEAFISATQAGGLFNGMLEKQADGLAGVQAKLRGAITDALNKIGEENEGAIKGAVKATEELIKVLSKLSPLITDAVVAYGAYKTALVLTTAAEKAVATAKALHAVRTTALARAQIMLNNAIQANPYTAAAAALAAIAFAVYKLATNTTKAEQAQKAFNESIAKGQADIEKERLNIEQLFATLRNAKEGTEEWTKARDAILNGYGNYLKGLSDEIQTLKDVEGAYNAVKKAALESAKARAIESANEESQSRYSEALKSAFEGVDKIIDRVDEKLDKAGKTARERADATAKLRREMYEMVRGDSKSIKLEKGSTEQNLWKNLNIGGDFAHIYSEVSAARAQYQKEVSVTRERFGTLEKKAAEETKIHLNTVAEETKAITAQIKEKKKQVAELRKADATANVSHIENLQKEIQDLQKRRDTLTGRDSSKSGDTNKTDPQAKLKEEVQARRVYEDLLSKQIASSIAVQTDGWQKEVQTIEEGHRLKVQAIEREREDLLMARQAKGQGLTTEEESGFATRIQAEQTLLEQSIAKRVDEETKANEEVLNDYLTYLQKRENLIKEAAEKEAQIRKSAEALGVDPTEYIEELKEQTNEALTALDEATAQKQATYRAWLESMRDKSLEQLKIAAQKAREELQRLKAEGKAAGNEIAVASAKVSSLEKSIKETEAKSNDGSKNSEAKWTDLSTVIDTASQSFERMGQEIGGVAGEVISTIGTVAGGTTQIINGVKAIGTTAKGAAGAVEKASAVLAIVSAAFQIGMKVAKLFNNDKQKDEQIKALGAEIQDLQWQLQNAQKLQRLQFDASGAVIAQYGKEVAGVTKALSDAHARSLITIREGESLWAAFSRAGEESNKAFAKAIATSYKELDYTVTQALGADKFKEVARQIDNIAEQTNKLKQQQEAERSKKKSDAGAIDGYEHKIKENALKAREIINKATDDIMGGGAQSIAQKLGDALIEAFKKGEDGAKAWGATVKGIVSDIVKRMLISKLVEQPIGHIFDKYQKEWFGSDAKFKGIDAVADSLPGLATELEVAGVGMMEALKHLSPALEGVLKIADEAEDKRTAERKGIATASQESVDELNGRATAIQGHTYLIESHTRELKMVTNSILSEVTAIRTNTDTLHDIKKELTTVRGSISEMQVKGIKTL